MIFLYFHELHHNVCPSAKMMAGQGWLWLIAVDHTSWSAWSVTTTSHLSHLLWTLSSSQSSSSPSSSSASSSHRKSPIISSVCFVLIHIKDRSWRLLSEAITGCCISYAWSGLHILPAIMRHKEFSRFWEIILGPVPTQFWSREFTKYYQKLLFSDNLSMTRVLQKKSAKCFLIQSLQQERVFLFFYLNKKLYT